MAMRFITSKQVQEPTGATDFLQRDARLAALLPAARRMANLQRDCAEVLPTAFKFCEILAFNETEMTLSTPNAAVAAKLKQQLPKLQETLLGKGWQINNIRLKVQMMRSASEKPQEPVDMSLSDAAVDSFARLSETLEQSKQNAPLIAALQNLVARRR